MARPRHSSCIACAPGSPGLRSAPVLCPRSLLFARADPAVRAEAETSLAVFSQSLDYVPQCQAILRGTSSPYAQMMVASSLLRLVSDQPMTVSMRAELRQFLLDVISTKGPSMEAWVVTKTCTLLARITKLGWFEDDRHRHVVEDASKFLDSGSVPHLMLGLRLLTHVVNEVNAPTPNRSLSEHRKVAVSFRDLALLKIFQLAVQYLRQLHQSGPSQQAMREVLVRLSFAKQATVAAISLQRVGAYPTGRCCPRFHPPAEQPRPPCPARSWAWRRRA